MYSSLLLFELIDINFGPVVTYDRVLAIARLLYIKVIRQCLLHAASELLLIFFRFLFRVHLLRF
jgi:hypothetical protein